MCNALAKVRVPEEGRPEQSVRTSVLWVQDCHGSGSDQQANQGTGQDLPKKLMRTN